MKSRLSLTNRFIYLPNKIVCQLDLHIHCLLVKALYFPGAANLRNSPVSSKDDPTHLTPNSYWYILHFYTLYTFDFLAYQVFCLFKITSYISALTHFDILNFILGEAGLQSPNTAKWLFLIIWQCQQNCDEAVYIKSYVKGLFKMKLLTKTLSYTDLHFGYQWS